MEGAPKLKMGTLQHIEHKPIGSNAFPLIQEFRKGIKTYTTDEDEYDKDWNFTGIMSATAPHLMRVSGTGQCTSH